FELFTLRDCLAQPSRYAAYLAAVAGGRVVSMNPVWNDLFMNKGLMALVQEEAAGGLPVQDGALVQSLLPWTMLVESATLGLIRARPREALVLKAANGYGGKDVHCGWTLAQGAWDRMLVQAAEGAEAFVVQERVSGQKMPVIGMTPKGDFIETEAAPVVGVFCDGDRYAGAFARASLSDQAVVNAHNQAAIGVVRLS
ncbi:MAG: hypothetical protein ORN49_05565, partial [Rhodobacteraceae bacterium]|nr:hypothetical protein [Paracoccaceae bacterium]